MKPTTFGMKPRHKRITIFKLGNGWVFKYFFGDKELFKELAENYNKGRYRFEFKNMAELEKASDFLRKNGFIIDLIEDPNNYLIRIEKTKKYAPILKNSLEYTETPLERIFLMKDLASVEEALDFGAEIYEGNVRF